MKINWSIVMLGSSLVTLSAVAFQAQQATQKHRATALGLLGDYANFAVFNYGGRIAPELQRIAQHAVEPKHSKRVSEAYTALGLDAPHAMECSCGDATIEAIGYFRYSRATQSLTSTAPISQPTGRSVKARIALYADSAGVLSRSVLRALPGEPRLVAFREIDNGSGDVFGALIEAKQIATFLETKTCRHKLLPASLTRGVATDSLVNLAVYLPGDKAPIFSSAPNPTWLAMREDTLSGRIGGLVLRAAIREDLAPSLIIGGLPRSRLPLLLVLLAISGGLALMALLQGRRERALVRMRESFVTSVSHELRTPLAQMQLYLDTVRMGRTTTTAERDWAMSHIARETTRLTHLVENVLHVSKPHVVSTAAAPVIDLGAEVTEVVESFRALARSRRARLVSSLDPNAMVAMRSEHLRQIMLNLLDNAVKYGPLGQQVSIETKVKGDVVEIAIADEGPGVLPDEQQKIWEPYFRGSTPEAVASGGTGIGLSIVRDLVTQYGGSVMLFPSDRGARFVVAMPRVHVGPRSAAPERVAQSG